MNIYDDFISSIMKNLISFSNFLRMSLNTGLLLVCFLLEGVTISLLLVGGVYCFPFFFYCLKNARDFKAEPVLKISLDDLLTR